MDELQVLKEKLKEEKKDYYTTFSEDIIDKVKNLKNQNWNTLTDEDRALIKKVAGHLKAIRKVQDKIDLIELGATRRSLRKKRVKAKKWQKKMEDREIKLNRLKSYLDNSTKLFSLDIENHEFSNAITEVGVSIYENGVIETHHFIVKEFLARRNRKYVPDHKDNFVFGESKILPLKDIKVKVKELYENSTYIVGHAFKNDIGFLRSCNCKTVKVLDTQTYAVFYFKNENHMSLSHIAEKLNLHTEFLHNAGNDANVTMEALLKMSNLKEG